MNIPITINRIKPVIDYQKLADKYEVYMLTTTDKYIKSGALILDQPVVNNDVYSLRFLKGNGVMVMMTKQEGNRKKLVDALRKYDDGDKFNVKKVELEDLERNVLIQLLLNGLSNFEHESLKFNNLSGHLYCFNQNWFERMKRADADEIIKIPTLEIKVESDFSLQLNVCTFSSELLKKKIDYKKKKFDDYPKYVMNPNRTLRRKLDGDSSRVFIMRQTKNTKREIPFLDIKNYESFNKTKMGVLADVVSKFNKRYENICSIGFELIEEYTAVEYSRRAAKEDKHVIEQLFCSMPVKIVDLIGDQYSERLCLDLKDKLKEKYDVEAILGKRPSKDSLNICVIHNKEYYGEEEDPHNRKYDGYVIQHITLEDFASASEFAVQAVVHELLIKEDLKNGKITLFDWNSLGFTEDVLFAVRNQSVDGDKFYVMNIHSDGCFIIKEQLLDLFDAVEYETFVNIFEDADANGDSVAGIVKMGEDINIIKKTNLITLPEFMKIAAELKEGNTKLRGKEKRTELMNSVLDIKSFSSGEGLCYFVGTIGEGMRQDIKRAANIREITANDDSKLIFEKLLATMSVSFVRNGHLTVVPFPFKYLNEYVKCDSRYKLYVVS